MNEKIKNYLGYALILGVLLVAVSAVSYARTYSRSVEPGGYRSFSVAAEGKAIAVPDVAQFTFSVVTEGGRDLGATQSRNTERATAAINYVKAQGVADGDIRTAGYNVEPRYQYTNCRGAVCPPPEIVGYTVRQTVTVKARDFATVGGLLSGVVASGANTVSQLNFIVDDPTVVEAEARAEAIKKAQVKAKDIARAGGFRLGSLISIDEIRGDDMYFRYPMMVPEPEGLGGAGDVMLPPVSIEPGSNEVAVTVILHYAIQ